MPATPVIETDSDSPGINPTAYCSMRNCSFDSSYSAAGETCRSSPSGTKSSVSMFRRLSSGLIGAINSLYSDVAGVR